MSNLRRSARGIVIDYDLMVLKHQLASSPTTSATTDRQEFVEAKTNRRIRRSQGNPANRTTEETAAKDETEQQAPETPKARRLNKTTPK